MWLLNTTTFKLHEFLSRPPLYAILSHTWEDEEVSFEEFLNGGFEHKLGYQKIKGCCAIAREDGYQFCWIDTCCIDKRSSAELSEAVNSMFRWYSDAAVCYAYLVDADVKSSLTISEYFRSSRWFTRGWTL
jgi:hypothetical protein